MSDVVVAAARVRLVIRGARSLKEKRKVVRSIKDRLPQLFPIAVAEVADMDVYQSAILGLCAVGNDGRHLTSILQKAIDRLRAHPEAQLVDSDLQLLRMD